MIKWFFAVLAFLSMNSAFGQETSSHYKVFAEEIRAPGVAGGKLLQLSIVVVPDIDPHQSKILGFFKIPTNPFGTDWRILTSQLEVALNKNEIKLTRLEPMVELLGAFGSLNSESHFASFLNALGINNMITFQRAPSQSCNAILSEIDSKTEGLLGSKTVSDRIVALRKNAKISQAEMAQKLDVSQSVISRLESGKQSPDIQTLDKIANFFGLNAKDLL